jgi:hypothetical protein
MAAWVALALTAPDDARSRGLAIALGAAFVFVVTYFPRAALFVSILLPTVLHVFVFTAAFMLVGAFKTRSRVAYASVLVFMLCAGSFLLPVELPGHGSVVPQISGMQFFQPVADFLKGLGFPASTNAQLFGFLSFAYTYHYLNWFSKMEVIRWHRIPRTRMQAIVIVYAITIALYAYNFTAGFLLSALLSNLHVLLEFPLNLRTFAALRRWRSLSQ